MSSEGYIPCDCDDLFESTCIVVKMHNHHHHDPVPGEEDPHRLRVLRGDAHFEALKCSTLNGANMTDPSDPGGSRWLPYVG